MTDTTSIQHAVRERHVHPAVVVPQLGLTTLAAQATLGSFFGSFVLVIAQILLVYHPYNGLFIMYLPFLLAFGLATGVPAGLLIWAGAKVARGPLHTINRCVLGVLVLSVASFFLWLSWFEQDTSPEVQRWALPVILVPGIMIGLITGSRLRLGRELIRGGEATALKLLAGLTGLLLRVVVVFLFLASVITTISVLQLYSHATTQLPAQVRAELIWTVLLFCHSTLAVVVLFVRMKIWPLAILTTIAATPVFASLFVAEIDPLVRYIVIGYLATWAMFLLTRWRQTDVALSALEKELRYYLID